MNDKSIILHHLILILLWDTYLIVIRSVHVECPIPWNGEDQHHFYGTKKSEGGITRACLVEVNPTTGI